MTTLLQIPHLLRPYSGFAKRRIRAIRAIRAIRETIRETIREIRGGPDAE